MTQQVNLFNPALREKQSPLVFKTAALGWAAVAIVIALAATWLGMSNHSLATQETEVSTRLDAAREDLKKLGAQAAGRQYDPQVAVELARFETQVRDHHEVMEYLKAGELGDTRGFSEHFKAFARQSFEGMWLTGLHIASSGNDMTVEGRALKAEYVPGYLKRLNGERVMQGHPFSELIIGQPEPEAADKPGVQPGFVEFRIATRAQEKPLAGGAQQ